MKSLKVLASDALPWLAFSACLCLLCVNVLLHRRNAELEGQVQSLEASDAPSVGSHIGTLRGTSLDGKPMVLDLAHRAGPSLVMVMSPFCQYCAKTLPKWRDMLSLIGPENAVLADMTGALDQNYLRQSRLESVRNVLHIDPPEGLLHGFRVVPTTVLLDREGRVESSWAGVLDDEEATAFSRALRATLAGSTIQNPTTGGDL